MNFSDPPRERRTIGLWPDWSARAAIEESRVLRQRIDRGGSRDDRRKQEAARRKHVAAICEEWATGEQPGDGRHPACRSAADHELARVAIGDRLKPDRARPSQPGAKSGRTGRSERE
jgi:hypothetical protein